MTTASFPASASIASIAPADIAGELMALLRSGGLAALRLGGRTLLPIVQGGMGVGISAHRLAGSVAALGAVGTISSVDLRRHHPDLMERTRGLAAGKAATAAAKKSINEANLEALGREIGAARQLADGRGLLAINVMRAVSEYGPSVTRALECGIDAVVVGAGLPLDLPDLAQEHPRALLVPIAPSAATLPARRCADTPTPMPPCTMGKSSLPPRCSGARPPARSKAIKSPVPWRVASAACATSIIVRQRQARRTVATGAR